MKHYKVIGIMSGTSMDGVDLAYCEFWQTNQHWQFEIKHAETIPYNKTWLVRLTELHKQPIHLLPKTDAYYGKYLGQLVNAFIKTHALQVDFIASHGHTIFHQPQNGFTTQIGCGANLFAETGIKTIKNPEIKLITGLPCSCAWWCACLDRSSLACWVPAGCPVP